MAWQVLLLRLPDSLGSLGDLAEGYELPILGEADAVGERITLAASGAEVRCDVTPSLIVVRSEDFVIEADLGSVPEVDHVLLSVLGSDAAWPLVGRVARALGAAAVDCETDAVLDPDASAPHSLRRWQARIDELR